MELRFGVWVELAVSAAAAVVVVPVTSATTEGCFVESVEPAVSQSVTEGQQSLAVTMEQVLKVPVAAAPDFCCVFLVVPVVSSVAEES